MIIIERDYKQLSEAWFQKHAGKVGASSLSKIITSTGKRSTQRQAYLYTMAAEILTGKRHEGFSNQYMAAGIENEPQTRMEFQLETMSQVEEVGGIMNSKYPGVFISPDGIIDGDMGLELKSVIPSTQVKYLDKDKLPTEYLLQCQMSLWVTEWNQWHFFSFCPGLKPLHVAVERDEALIRIIHAEINIFIEDLNKLVEKLRA